MGASHDVLRELVTAERFCDTEVAYISRCDYPPWADACLALFEAAPGVTLAQAAQYSVGLKLDVYASHLLIMIIKHSGLERLPGAVPGVMLAQAAQYLVRLGTCVGHSPLMITCAVFHIASLVLCEAAPGVSAVHPAAQLQCSLRLP